jgi:hypothetical protein
MVASLMNSHTRVSMCEHECTDFEFEGHILGGNRND